MSLLPIQHKNTVSENLSPAICKSGDLRLPTKFTRLNRQYIEQEFALSEAVITPKQEIVVEMYDGAMYPTIGIGAQLVVDENAQPKHNDIVWVKYYGEMICRRIFISKRKSWLFGDDKNFKFIDLSKNIDVEILGVVTSHFINHNVA